MVKGVKYFSAEQFLQARRAEKFGDQESLNKIMQTKIPRVQKAIGDKVKGFSADIWKETCQDLVFPGLLEKFKQCAEAKDFLLKTEDTELVEASASDSFWGIGRNMYDDRLMDTKDEWGSNILGKRLMDIRNTLKNT